MIVYPELPAAYGALSDVADFIKIWDQARAGRLIPKRADLTLTKLRSLAANTAFVGYKNPRQVDYLQTGTHICDRIGFDPTGQNLLDFVPMLKRGKTSRLLRAMVETPCGSIMTVKNRYKYKKTSEFTLLFLPVEGNQGEQIIAGFYSYADKLRPSTSKDKRQNISIKARSLHLIDIGVGVP